MNNKILGMGNAVLDILAETSDKYLIQNKLKKGTMILVEQKDKRQEESKDIVHLVSR